MVIVKQETKPPLAFYGLLSHPKKNRFVNVCFVFFLNLLMIFFFRLVSFLLYLVSFLLCLVSFHFVSSLFRFLIYNHQARKGSGHVSLYVCVGVVSLFLRFCDLVLELFRQCGIYFFYFIYYLRYFFISKYKK